MAPLRQFRRANSLPCLLETAPSPLLSLPPPRTSYTSSVAQAFASRILCAINEASILLLVSIGHQLGLFHHLRTPHSLRSLSLRARLPQTRLLHEWLRAMHCASILEAQYTEKGWRYWIHAQHIQWLTGSTMNYATLSQYIGIFARMLRNEGKGGEKVHLERVRQLEIEMRVDIDKLVQLLGGQDVLVGGRVVVIGGRGERVITELARRFSGCWFGVYGKGKAGGNVQVRNVEQLKERRVYDVGLVLDERSLAGVKGVKESLRQGGKVICWGGGRELWERVGRFMEGGGGRNVEDKLMGLGFSRVYCVGEGFYVAE